MAPLRGQPGGGDGDPVVIAAVVAGFVGVTLMLRPGSGSHPALPALMGLGSGLLSAVAYLQVRALSTAGEPETRTVFWFSAGGCATGLMLQGLGAGAWHSLWRPEAGWLLATGLLATTAQWLLTRAYGLGQVLTNATLNYLGLVFSFTLGVLVFGDPVGWPEVIGAGMIVAAGLLATARSSRPAPARPAP